MECPQVQCCTYVHYVGIDSLLTCHMFIPSNTTESKAMQRENLVSKSSLQSSFSLLTTSLPTSPAPSSSFPSFIRTDDNDQIYSLGGAAAVFYQRSPHRLQALTLALRCCLHLCSWTLSQNLLRELHL